MSTTTMYKKKNLFDPGAKLREKVGTGKDVEEGVLDPVGLWEDPNAEAKKQYAEQKALIMKQMQQEEAALAESESDVARRRAILRKQGTSRSLLKSNTAGAANLGGTS